MPSLQLNVLVYFSVVPFYSMLFCSVLYCSVIFMAIKIREQKLKIITNMAIVVVLTLPMKAQTAKINRSYDGIKAKKWEMKSPIIRPLKLYKVNCNMKSRLTKAYKLI